MFYLKQITVRLQRIWLPRTQAKRVMLSGARTAATNTVCDTVFVGVDMTLKNDEGGDPRGTLGSPALATTAAARDALRAGTVVPVALGLMLGIAYLGYAHLQRQIEAQHAGFVAQLQPMKQKIHEMAAAQSQTNAEIAKLVTQSEPPKSEIQGLQNHANNLRGRTKKQKK